MPKTREQLISELAELRARQEHIKDARPNDYFKPMPGGQRRFWDDRRKEKWIFGGNQSGKTTTLTNKVLEAMKTQPGIRVYVGSTSMDRSRKVSQKTFWEWVNKPDVRDGVTYKEDLGFRNDCLPMKNGSVAFFLSYEMEQDKWASDTIDIVAFDEEPPWHIFTEAQKRVIAKNGCIYGAMTALKSYTRLVNRIYLEENDRIGLFTVPLHENHVKHGGRFTDERIREVINDTPASERPSRIYGIPTYKTGLVYDEWRDEEPWVIPRSKEFSIPGFWTRYAGIDPHAALPQAALMFAVSPKKDIYIYREMWEKTLIPDFARMMKAAAMPTQFEAVLIDNHYSTQQNAESGKTIKQLLLEYGDIMTIGGCDDVIARIDMVKAWDRVSPVTGKPMIQTFESCTQTRWERKRYEWQAPISERVAERRDARQRPKDKHGHLMNCLEYVAAYGGKDGLEYVPPPPTAAMEARIQYWSQKEKEEEMERDYDETGYDALEYHKDSLAHQYS